VIRWMRSRSRSASVRTAVYHFTTITSSTSQAANQHYDRITTVVDSGPTHYKKTSKVNRIEQAGKLSINKNYNQWCTNNRSSSLRKLFASSTGTYYSNKHNQ
jgi:hypothetical protein